MAKNLVIFGSPNKASFTAKLTQSEIAALSGEVAVYDCFSSSPAPCNGCRGCETSYGCVKADLDDFFELFKKAEEVILAFPVYNGSFPAPLKALLDRFQWLFSARFCQNRRPPIEGRRRVTLIITAGAEKDPLPLILAQLKPLFTVCGCQIKKTVVLCGTDSKSPLPPVVTQYPQT